MGLSTKRDNHTDTSSLTIRKTNVSKCECNNKLTVINYFSFPDRKILPRFPIPEIIKKSLKTTDPQQKLSIPCEQIKVILERLPRVKHLEEYCYLHMLKLLLYIEEYTEFKAAQTISVLKGGITIVDYMGRESVYSISIPKIDEEELSSLQFSNEVHVFPSNDTTCGNRVYIFRILSVNSTRIIAAPSTRFKEDFSNKRAFYTDFKIRIIPSNYTFRCAHYALYQINGTLPASTFFPCIKPVYNKPTEPLCWFNKNIQANPEQRQAVLNIACKSAYPAPYILYGPPGTGKTATLVEAICQVWQNDPSNRILICTPSNAAADEITSRLLKYIPENSNLFRMYSSSKTVADIPPGIIPCSNIVQGVSVELPVEIIERKKIIITTLCTCLRLIIRNLSAKHFTYVFIDEAGQATEPDCLIPYGLLANPDDQRIHAQVVLAGDPKQLGPVTKSKLVEHLLGRSMLERLMDGKPYTKNMNQEYNVSYITKLVQNYRSHASLIKVSSDLFYDSELIPCAGDETKRAEKWSGLQTKGFPMLFHLVTGHEQSMKGSTSKWNLQEMKVVMHYIRRLVGRKLGDHILEAKDIGIVTPYALQRKKLKDCLNNNQLNDIEVGTVELFQGREKDVIILTTVRSKVFFNNNEPHIGFLSNPKRFNVALTRAKALMIIIGNPEVLQLDKNWGYLIRYCFDNNAILGDYTKMPKMQKEKMKNKKDNATITVVDKKRTFSPSITQGKNHTDLLESDSFDLDSFDSRNNSSSDLHESSPSPQSNETHEESILPKDSLNSSHLLTDIVIKDLGGLSLENCPPNANKKEVTVIS